MIRTSYEAPSSPRRPRHRGALAGALVLAALAVPAAAAAQQPPPPDPNTCRNRPETRQLDFWIGTWDVYHPDTGAQMGVNVIEPVEGLNNCALMENWTSARGFDGKSLNFYDPQRRTWRQVWVDGFGAVLDYREGELKEGAMHFSGITINPQGDTVLQKLIFEPVAADTVRQIFESSRDRGASWSRDWVGIYVRRAGTTGAGG